MMLLPIPDSQNCIKSRDYLPQVSVCMHWLDHICFPFHISDKPVRLDFLRVSLFLLIKNNELSTPCG